MNVLQRIFGRDAAQTPRAAGSGLDAPALDEKGGAEQSGPDSRRLVWADNDAEAAAVHELWLRASAVTIVSEYVSAPASTPIRMSARVLRGHARAAGRGGLGPCGGVCARLSRSLGGQGL
jgi:hypothetical protein